jgi:hypothetical protein
VVAAWSAVALVGSYKMLMVIIRYMPSCRSIASPRATREPTEALCRWARWDTGLNSTPELSWMFLLVICLQALKFSYEHSVSARDKKGMVSRMSGMSVSLGGRSAASLAAAYSTFVGCVELSGGSG